MVLFNELFSKAISMWPDELNVSEKVIHKNGGATISSLTKAHDEIEEKFFLIEESYELRQMDWAIYTVLHELSISKNKIVIKDIDINNVRRVYEENMQE